MIYTRVKNFNMVRFIIIFIFFVFSYGICKDKLVIISPHWEGVKIEIAQAFKKWYMENYGKEVEIEYIDQGGTADDLRFVESLFKKNPDGIGIDIFFGGGTAPYLRLKEKGLLARYKVKDEILRNIPKRCAGIPTYDKDFYWYGVVLSSFGILYNKKVLKYLGLPYPKKWEDLGKECYFSWVGAADPRHSGSMHMMYEIILQSYGWEKGWQVIFSLAGNTKHFSKSASQVAKDTSIGEVALSLCIDSYALSQIEINGEENMGFAIPEGLTVINPDSVGILKGAPHYKVACRFIDFLLSYQGQLLWMVKRGEKGGPKEFSLHRFSIRPDVYRHPKIIFRSLNPYRYKGTLNYNFKLASKRWVLLNDMIGSCIIDCHKELVKAWKIVLKSKNEKLREEFYRLPFDEKLQKFFWSNWHDQIFRNKYINWWLNFSRRKFKRIIEEFNLIY